MRFREPCRRDKPLRAVMPCDLGLLMLRSEAAQKLQGPLGDLGGVSARDQQVQSLPGGQRAARAGVCGPDLSGYFCEAGHQGSDGAGEDDRAFAPGDRAVGKGRRVRWSYPSMK